MQGELLLLLVVHLVLTGLPGVAAALWAAACGVRQVPVLLALWLAASGAGAMVGFWAYYADPVAGETFSYFLVLGSALAVGRVLMTRAVEVGILRDLAVPLGLWALGSTFLVFLGFMHGGVAHPLSVPQVRFFETLPGDNLIPPFFADWFYANGHHGTPPEFPGEWLAGDRPPLQMGYAMVQRPFAWDTTGLHYEILGVVLQQLWIVGLWALLLAARVGRTTRALTMGTVLVSGLVIVNGFYAWPKLLPAALLLAVAALVLTPLWEEVRGSLWAAALLAALCGLAMLAHGASIFGIVPLLAIAAYRGKPSGRWIGVAALVGVVALAPWSAYQKYGDPPCNRLVKWQIGGVVEVDDRSVGEAIADTYGEIGVGGAIDYKLENFETIVGGEEAYESLKNGFDDGNLTAVVRAIRSVSFFFLIPSLGLLLLGPVAMALRWRRGPREEPEWRLALLCFAAFGIGTVLWGLVIIGGEPARTSIHVGSYLIPLLGAVGCIAALRAAMPRFAVPYLVSAALLSLAIYVPFFEPLPETSFSLADAVLAALALAGFVALTAFLPDRDPEAGGEEGHRHQSEDVGQAVLG